MFTLKDKALRYHRALHPGLMYHLGQCGILKVHVYAHLLGWDGERVTVPVFDEVRQVVGFEYWKQTDECFEVDHARSDTTALYGSLGRYRVEPTVVVTEGIQESLVLAGKQFMAVSATGTGREFKEEWAACFSHAGEVFVCFKRSPESLEAARKVAKMIPRAQVVILPMGVGTGGGLYDFFYRLKAWRTDFLRLLAETSHGHDS